MTGVNTSRGVNNSYGVNNSRGVNASLFVYKKQSPNYLFNKIVTLSRVREVKTKLNIILQKNNWNWSANNYLELKEKYGEYSKINPSLIKEKNIYENFPQEAIDYLKSLPEFDKDVFFGVTGIKV